MFNRFRRRVIFAAFFALGASAMAVGGAKLASAAPSCTISWAAAISGDWSDSLLWTGNRLPESTDNVCIQLEGTYTVNLSHEYPIASFQIGAASGTQTLQLNGIPTSGGMADVSGPVIIGSTGVLTMTSTGGSSPASFGSPTSTTSNAGTINSLAGAGGGRYLYGNIDNNGDVNISANTQYVYGSPSTFTNQGTVDLTAQFSVFSSTSFTNATGGSVNATGAGELNEGSGTFTQGAGITTGNPVQIDSNATLNFTGSGASTFSVYTMARLQGTSVAGQTVYVREGAPYSEARFIDGFTNGGVITLSSIVGADNAALDADVEGGTMHNTGTINVLPGTGGGRGLYGNIDNTGDINISANTNYTGPGTFTNHGTVDLTAQLSVFSSTNFTNATGGSVNATGAGELNESSGTFTQGAGITTGNPVQIDSNSTLNFTGSGASTFSVYTMAKLKGTSVAGQTVYVREGAPYSEAFFIDGFTNGGTITVSSIVGADNAALVADASGGTMHNTGTINVLAGTGGQRSLGGNIDNSGTINISANTQYYDNPTTFTNRGVLHITPGQTLSLSGVTYAQTSVGTFLTDIASASSYGKMTSDLALTLAGTIATNTTYSPAAGTTFTALTFPSRTGAFSSSSFAGGTTYTVNQNATNVVLVPAGAAVLKPDAMIRVGTTSPFVGNNVYNATGKHQSKSKKSARNTTVIFQVAVANDGNAADTFKVSAAGDAAGYTVTYLSGATDVTAAVVAGSYTTASLAPGQSAVLTVRIVVQATAAAHSKVVRLVTVTSVGAPASEDAVKWTVKRS